MPRFLLLDRFTQLPVDGLSFRSQNDIVGVGVKAMANASWTRGRDPRTRDQEGLNASLQPRNVTQQLT